MLGVDPGKTGALALFQPLRTAESGLRWIVIDMPVVDDELNAMAIRDWIMRHSPDHAFIEHVTAMPSIADKKTGVRRRMGATGAFHFGGMFYGIKAIIACCGIPITLVTAGKWKKAHGLVGPDKEKSRKRAIELYPDMASALARKKDANRAEAMLIAHWGDMQERLIKAA
jgi:crossover junction endodeoxyribonuclease RuvC